jgi:CBS domain-containing protein
MMNLSDFRKRITLKHSEDYYIKKLLTMVPLQEVMASPVISVKMDVHFRVVPELFSRHHFRHLPIVDEKDILVGLITQTDLLRIVPPHKTMEGEWMYDQEALDGIVLRDVMQAQPFTMRETDTLGEAIVQMVNHRYGCIPVVDQKHLLKGILTQFDILTIAAAIYTE